MTLGSRCPNPEGCTGLLAAYCPNPGCLNCPPRWIGWLRCHACHTSFNVRTHQAIDMQGRPVDWPWPESEPEPEAT